MFGVHNVEAIIALIGRHKNAVLQNENYAVCSVKNGDNRTYSSSDASRIDRSVFFTDTGLTRDALKSEFGEGWSNYLKSKI